MYRKHKLLSLVFIFLSSFAFSNNFFTFSGTVRDSISGEYIEGVDVFVRNNTTGTLTTNRGDFLLYLSPGDYEVWFSCNGYQSQTMKVPLHENAEHHISLVKQSKNVKNYQPWPRARNHTRIAQNSRTLTDTEPEKY